MTTVSDSRADALILKVEALREKRSRLLQAGDFRRSEEAAEELKVAAAELAERLAALSAKQQTPYATTEGTTP